MLNTWQMTNKINSDSIILFIHAHFNSKKAQNCLN